MKDMTAFVLWLKTQMDVMAKMTNREDFTPEQKSRFTYLEAALCAVSEFNDDLLRAALGDQTVSQLAQIQRQWFMKDRKEDQS